MVNSSLQDCRDNTIYQEFLNPIYNNLSIIMGQNQCIMHRMNTLSNPVPIMKEVVKNVVSPVVVQVSKCRKTCVQRVGSEIHKGNIILHHMCIGLTTVVEMWKEYNYGWDNDSPLLRELETKHGSKWHNKKSSSTGKVQRCRR